MPEIGEITIVQLEATRDRIQQICTPLPLDFAERVPARGGWSLAGIIEHLAVVETRILMGIRTALAGKMADAATVEATDGKYEVIWSRVAVRASKIEAPAPTLPQGRYEAWPNALTAFLRAREKTLALARTANDSFEAKVFHHPVLGPLTIGQWLAFVAAHSARHCTQIEETLSLATLPSLP